MGSMIERIAAVAGIALFAAATPVTSQTEAGKVEVIKDDIHAAWTERRRVLPVGERGLVYPGESITLSGSGRIDRNHVHEKSDESVFLFFKKEKVVDYPQFVNHAEHPMQVTVVQQNAPATILKGPERLVSGSVTWEVPGAPQVPAAVLAFVPNTPVEVNRNRSYGAYQLSVSIAPGRRLELVRQRLRDQRMTAQEIRHADFLNRRLVMWSAPEVADAIIEQYQRHHTGRSANRDQAEGVVKLAVDLAPTNGRARQVLGDFYIQTGRWESGQQELRKAVEDLSAQAKRDDKPETWGALGAAQRSLAEIALAKAGIPNPKQLDSAEYLYGEAAESYRKAGDLLAAVTTLKHQARVLWDLDRRKDAMAKAKRVLERAAALAPAPFAGDLVALSPDGRKAALLTKGGTLTSAAMGGAPAVLDTRPLSNPKIVAHDANANRLLLADGAALWWYDPAQNEPKVVPGNAPVLTQAHVGGGVVAGLTDDKNLALLMPGEAALRPRNGVASLAGDVQMLSLSPKGWVAALTGSGYNKIEVFQPGGVFSRAFTIDHLVPLDGADGDDASQAVPASPCLARQLAINDEGDVLLFMVNSLQPWRSRWELHIKDGMRRVLSLPSAPRPKFFDPPALPQNSWFDEFAASSGLGATPTTASVYWWATGQDVRAEWAQGSFSPTGQQIVLSNPVTGVTVLDAQTLTVSSMVPIPSLQQAGDAVRIPLGHRWVGQSIALVATGEVEAERITRIWLSKLDFSSGTIIETELSEADRQTFLDLGKEERHRLVAVGFDGQPTFWRVAQTRLRLVDVSRKAAIAAPPILETSGRSAVLNDGSMAVGLGSGVGVYDRTMTQVALLRGLARPGSLPDGQSWFGWRGSVIEVYRGTNKTAERPTTDGDYIIAQTGSHILLKNEADARRFKAVDLTTGATVEWQAASTFEKMVGFGIADGTAWVVLSHGWDATNGRVWMETSTGQAFPVAGPGDLAPTADFAHLEAKSITSADGKRQIVLVQQKDMDRGFIGSPDTVRTYYRLFTVNLAGQTQQQSPPVKIDSFSFGADSTLENVVVASGGELVTYELQTQRIRSRIPAHGSVARVDSNGLTVTTYNTVTLWGQFGQ